MLNSLFFSIVKSEALDGEKCEYYSTIIITVGGQPDCHHQLQDAKSFDVVSFDGQGPCTIPESVLLDFFTRQVSHESLASEELKE